MLSWKFREVCLQSPPPRSFITHHLLSQLLVHIKRSTNDRSNIDLCRRELDLHRPTAFTFQSLCALSPFPFPRPNKKPRFLTLMQTRHFGIFFTPFPVMFHFFPSFGSWTFLYFGNEPYCGFASHFFICFFSFFPYPSSSPYLLTSRISIPTFLPIPLPLLPPLLLLRLWIVKRQHISITDYKPDDQFNNFLG
jgi:hypothetical protein